MRRVRDPDLLALMHLEGGECALTGSVQNLELHHIYPRSQGGSDVRANLVFLERATHWKITTNDVETRRALGAYILRDRHDFLEYLIDKLGEAQARDWFYRRLLVASDRQVA